MELDPGSGGSLKKSYYYAHAQVMALWDHTDPDGDGVFDDLYFYLHDRLGSVRQVIDESAAVMHYYTYDPFGQLLESASALNAPANAFMFTGQWYDQEIGQYHLRARMYDPALMRFTTRDTVKGQYTDTLTLHAYLYCQNDPINHTDPAGRFAIPTLLQRVGIGAALGGLTNETFAAIRGENIGMAVMKGAVTGAVGSLASLGFAAKFIGQANPTLLKALAMNLASETAETAAGMGFDLVANLISDDPQNIEFNLAEFTTNVLVGSIMDWGAPKIQDWVVGKKLKEQGKSWDGWEPGPDSISQTSLEKLAESYKMDIKDIILINNALTHIVTSSVGFIDY